MCVDSLTDTKCVSLLIGYVFFIYKKTLPYSWSTLQKHAYPNILKVLPPKNKRKKSEKNKSDIFHISAQNIDRGYSMRRF